ncbi:MAG: nickel pincer cofactor biosynthesis protein LarB [Thermoleophilia bacterium]
MNLRETLELLASGKLSVDEAQSKLSLVGIAALADFARLDLDRHARKGVPEVIYAPGKTTGQLVGICSEMLKQAGRAIASGVNNEQRQVLGEKFAGLVQVTNEDAQMIVLHRGDYKLEQTDGRVGILSAGTADIPVSEQAKIVAEEMGCEVIASYDAGVAGVHRLVEPLRQMIEARVSVIIVAAGMEGALPSVVAGLVPVPVIGLPTSTGYGLGGGGITALLSMLQSCCPGLVAVNIDNGVGAGATAALIANQVAASGHRSG